MTKFELAQTLVASEQYADGARRRRVVDARVRGTVLNSPSDGKERRSRRHSCSSTSGLLPPPLEEVVSPNGDGVAEEQALAYKVVRPSTVTVTLTAPDGQSRRRGPEGASRDRTRSHSRRSAAAAPTARGRASTGADHALPPAEGRWTLTVTAIDDQGLSSTATRRFAVNSTLGFLRIEPTRPASPKNGGRTAAIRWTQTRAARVSVTVETVEEVLVRTVANQRFEAGGRAIAWDGRANWGDSLRGGRHSTIRVASTNELGAVELEQPLTVRRTAKALTGSDPWG